MEEGLDFYFGCLQAAYLGREQLHARHVGLVGMPTLLVQRRATNVHQVSSEKRITEMLALLPGLSLGRDTINCDSSHLEDNLRFLPTRYPYSSILSFPRLGLCILSQQALTKCVIHYQDAFPVREQLRATSVPRVGMPALWPPRSVFLVHQDIIPTIREAEPYLRAYRVQAVCIQTLLLRPRVSNVQLAASPRPLEKLLCARCVRPVAIQTLPP